MNKQELQEIRDELKGISKYPWHYDEESESVFEIEEEEVITRGIYSKEGPLNKGEEYELFGEKDADFIAKAPGRIEKLLDEVDGLRSHIIKHSNISNHGEVCFCSICNEKKKLCSTASVKVEY